MRCCRTSVVLGVIAFFATVFVGAVSAQEPLGSKNWCQEDGATAPDDTPVRLGPENNRGNLPACANQYCKLVVQLPEPPPSHVRCSVDAKDGQHVEFEWEPGGLPALAQSAVLKTGSDWTITCLADPYFRPLGPKSDEPSQNSGWVICNGLKTDQQGSVSVFLAPDVGNPNHRVQRYITASLQDLPDLKTTVENLGTVSGGTAGGRSLFITLPAVVEEVFRVLADIAIERAREGAARMLRRTLKQYVCVELTTAQMGFDQEFQKKLDGDGRPKIDDIQVNGKDAYTLLPRTCAAIDGLRLEHISSQAAVLFRALMSDATDIAFAWADLRFADPENQWFVKPMLRRTRAIIDMLIYEKSIDPRAEAQILLTDLAREAAKKVDKNETPTEKQCRTALVFAAMAVCHAAQRCDARLISNILATPEQFMDITTCKGKFGEVGELSFIVARAQEIFSPRPDTAPNKLIKAAVNLAFDIALLALPEDTKSENIKAKKTLEALRSISLAVVDSDVSGVMEGVWTIAEMSLKEPKRDGEDRTDTARPYYRKVVSIMTGLLAYVKTYIRIDGTESMTEEEKHTARKQAVESIIDAFGSRTDIAQRNVITLGSPVGFRASGFQVSFSSQDDLSTRSPKTIRDNATCYLYPQLSLPLGIGYQRLPNTTGWRGIGTGAHVMIYPIDLGQFTAYGEKIDTDNAPKWNAFLSPGFQVGLLVGTPEDSVVIAFDVSYSPFLEFEEQSGEDVTSVLRLSVVVAYYVNFIDFFRWGSQ